MRLLTFLVLLILIGLFIGFGYIVFYKNPSTLRNILRLERNKRNVIAFYQLMFNDNNPKAAMEKYAGATYTQHNPHVKDGKEGFIDYFTKMATQYPGKHLYIKRVIAEKNYVVLHCLQVWPGDHDWAGIDIFRLNDEGKVVEHWDVLQIVPKESANNNTMF